MLKNYPLDDPKIDLLGKSGFILLITTIESYLSGVLYRRNSSKYIRIPLHDR